MADTIQCVTWALAQTCPLRASGNWKDPSVALSTVGELHQWYDWKQSNHRHGFGVFEGICVTGVTCPVSDLAPCYPSSGFEILAKFSKYGGIEALKGLCGSCPANAGPDGIAGCTGLFQQPFYKKDNEQLERIIDSLGLQKRVKNCFPTTKPLWFCFWMNSPLSPECVEILHQIILAIHAEDPQKFSPSCKSRTSFLAALQRSLTHGLEMHVSYSPPGHTDFGWYTIFPHCPRCKAEAPVKRWKRKYSEVEIVCPVCGKVYSPNSTASSTRDDYDNDDLRKTMGTVAFAEFAVRYLIALGLSQEKAAEVVMKQEEYHSRQEQEMAQKREQHRQQQLYIENVICNGLKNRSAGLDTDGRGWLFSKVDFLELLRRCEAQQIHVLQIGHISSSGDLDEHVSVQGTAQHALKAFQRLEKEGCNEKFSANLHVPDDQVRRWWNSQPKK